MLSNTVFGKLYLSFVGHFVTLKENNSINILFWKKKKKIKDSLIWVFVRADQSGFIMFAFFHLRNLSYKTESMFKTLCHISSKILSLLQEWNHTNFFFPLSCPFRHNYITFLWIRLGKSRSPFLATDFF